LDECRIIEEIKDAGLLHRFDMNKALDSDDEYNLVKRRSRTKPDLAIVRPWQNEIMATFMKQLFEEAGDRVLLRSYVLDKYNEAGVPITWARIAPFNYFFEKKNLYPPFAEKMTLVLPLKNPEANLRDLEKSIIAILLDKIELSKEKFTLPVRLADV
jgi:hypothetical protein